MGRKRVAKDPLERRREIIGAAGALFAEKGVSQTMVSDIVERIGVAQGTFYYYFKSKQEVLAVVLENQWEAAAASIMKRPETGGDDALATLDTLLGGLFGAGASDQAEDQYPLLGDPEILRDYHGLVDEARMKSLCPVVEGIVMEGITQGVFAPLSHPRDITRILFYGINAYMHRYTPQFTDENIRRDKTGALAELLCRVLGLAEGSLSFK